MQSASPGVPVQPGFDSRPRLWLDTVLALAALALLYVLTIPVNHTDAEDCLWYAYDTREKPYHALFHVHHLLYLPVMRLIHTTVPFLDAYHLMIGVDILCGVATVGIFFFWLERGLQLGRRASLFGCLFLAFCYNFWRYSDEAEVYAVANLLLALLALRVIRRGPAPPGAETWPGRVLTALLGTACMLIHSVLTLPLAVAAVPVYLLLKRRWRTFAIYGVLATVLVTGAYYTAFRIVSTAHDPALPAPPTFLKFLAEGSEGSGEVALTWKKIPQLPVGLGPAVISSDYLFAFPKVREKVFNAFPNRNFSKEFYTGRAYSPARADLSLAMAAVLVVLLAFMACRLDWSAPRRRRFLAAPETVAILLWAGTYIVLVGIVEPENPENWVSFLPALAAIAAVVVHGLYRGLEHAWLPWVFVGLLFTHNLVNGFLILRRPGSDLFRHRAAWVLAHAHAGDVVFTRDNDVFTRFVRYYSPARVVNLWADGEELTRRKVEQTPVAPGGARYLFTEVLTPPSYLCAIQPGLADQMAHLKQEMLPALQPTGSEDVTRLP